ncbi:MAG TPA: uroporphyrinogen decarboxylase family protein [Tepidisphaeraceae bacterium]|jgi:uroporphyrinogen decarboxylase
MTSRQRILAAINHRPVDRVPVDFGGTRQSGISAYAYAPLRKHLQTPAPEPMRIFDLFQMLAEIEPRVAARFGADCVALHRPAVAFGLSNAQYKTYRFDGIDEDALVPADFSPVTDAAGDLVLQRAGAVIARMPRGGFYFDRFEKYPGATHPDLATFSPPRLGAADLRHYEMASRHLFDETDKAVIAALGPPYELFNGIGQGGFEEWMMTFASEDDYVRALYDKLVDTWIENLIAFQRAVGDRVHILQIADDFGTQHAPFLSEAMFRDKLLPAYRRGLDWIHNHTGWKVMLHSDGAIFPLLDAIVEMGVDILNPVQTTADGMDARRLHERYGGKLVFWGGSCDCQNTLTYGTSQQVAAEVRENLRIFRPSDGGYVFAPVHNVQANVPPQNVAALFDTALGFL